MNPLKLTTPTVPPSFMYQAHGNMIRELSWSSDDRRLASAGADGFARITDVATGNTLSEFPQSFAVNSIIMDPHHDCASCALLLMSCSDDSNSAVVYSWARQECLCLGRPRPASQA